MRGTLCNLLVLSVMLSACASTRSPGIKIEYVDRPVIQVQKCIKRGDVPARPTALKTSEQPSDLERALSLALAKVSEWTRYGNKMDVIVRNCTEN